MKSDVVYAPTIRVERVRGPLRYAYLPAKDQPVAFGVHGAVAAHYGLPPDHPDAHATTIDYLIAATGG